MAASTRTWRGTSQCSSRNAASAASSRWCRHLTGTRRRWGRSSWVLGNAVEGMRAVRGVRRSGRRARIRIGHFIDFYNFSRTHTGIEGMVPADRFFQRYPGDAGEPARAGGGFNALELARSGVPKSQLYLAGECVGGIAGHAAWRRRPGHPLPRMASGRQVDFEPRVNPRPCPLRPSAATPPASVPMPMPVAPAGEVRSGWTGGDEARSFPAPRRSMRCPHPGATAAGREVRHGATPRLHPLQRPIPWPSASHSRGGSARCHTTAARSPLVVRGRLQRVGERVGRHGWPTGSGHARGDGQLSGQDHRRGGLWSGLTGLRSAPDAAPGAGSHGGAVLHRGGAGHRRPHHGLRAGRVWAGAWGGDRAGRWRVCARSTAGRSRNSLGCERSCAPPSAAWGGGLQVGAFAPAPSGSGPTGPGSGGVPAARWCGR